jgi:preprotein translocase subunit SecA
MCEQLLEYDDVANDQASDLPAANDIMDADNLAGQIASLREGCFSDPTRQYVPAESVEEQWDVVLKRCCGTMAD